MRGGAERDRVGPGAAGLEGRRRWWWAGLVAEGDRGRVCLGRIPDRVAEPHEHGVERLGLARERGVRRGVERERAQRTGLVLWRVAAARRDARLRACAGDPVDLADRIIRWLAGVRPGDRRGLVDP